jgi:hypothetical protein
MYRIPLATASASKSEETKLGAGSVCGHDVSPMMKALFGFLALVMTCTATSAAGRTVSFDVSGADEHEILAIRMILAEAARIAALEDRSQVVSDTKSVAWYGSQVVPISIAARSSAAAVQIRISWSPPGNAVVSASATLKRFGDIDAFLEKELTARFPNRVVRNLVSATRSRNSRCSRSQRHRL